jgi:Family of unknown function (DUF5670)
LTVGGKRLRAPVNRQPSTVNQPPGPVLAQPASMNLLWIIIIVLIILWLGGFSMSIGGNLIHILIVIALILLIVRLVSGRRVL